MKVTKRQLKRIIKEEKAKIINENYPIGGDDPSPDWVAFQKAAFTVASGFIDAGMEADGIMDAMNAEISEMIDDMTNDLDGYDYGRPSPSGVRGDIFTDERR